jgi:hypothetical protein
LAFSAVLPHNCVAFGKDFLNAEDAKVGAEFHGESSSSATLGGVLRDLGVKSVGLLQP